MRFGAGWHGLGQPDLPNRIDDWMDLGRDERAPMLL